MANGFEFNDYSDDVKRKIDNIINTWLHEASGEIITSTQRNSRTDTGKTKGSFSYKVSKYESNIGSNEQNAIWEEFGTGEYATHGDGRKGSWSYQDASGNWHRTNGKTPTHAFRKGYESNKRLIIDELQNKLGRL